MLGDDFNIGSSSSLHNDVVAEPSNVPWKGRAIFLPLEFAPPAAKDPNLYGFELEAMQAQLETLTSNLVRVARNRRRAILTTKRSRTATRNKNTLLALEAEFAKLNAARNRMSRRIHLHKKRNGERFFREQAGYPSVEVFTVGAPSCVCSFCGASMWFLESATSSRSSTTLLFSLCCKQGRVRLPPRRDPPTFLKDLLEGSTAICRHFCQFIRGYNGIFCFTSLGGKVDHSINNGAGVYVYSIGGQIYHRIGGLLPPEGTSPKFAQLYIYDTMNETRNRLDFYNQDREANPLRDYVVEGLQAMLDENNILVQTFRSARDRLNEGVIQQAHIRLLARRAGDGREYDLPSADEIAALIVDEAGEEMFGHDIIVQHRTMKMEQISMYHPSLMALQYPFLFPYGEDGWHPELFYYDGECVEGDDEDLLGQRNMSQCDYYSYVLQTRLEQSNSFLLAGKLLQQYMVNAYALVEAERLDWIRNNQTTLRAHYFQGLLDSFMRGDTDLELSGKHVILAASHTGSPRYKYENFQDAMAICRAFGYPDLFITFTCNANWPEIQLMSDLLALRGIKDPNRADAIARVYKMKLNQFMYEIKDRHIFGKTCAHVRALEFQKRGLPHAHILVFLAPEDKFCGTTDIDSIISAEIPDPALDPEGYEAVCNFMLHGPCGAVGPKSPCMKNGECSKHFPKQFCSQTTIDENGFAKYRRRQNNRCVTVKGVALDNRFVVPYNGYLLLRFQAHINVEFCNKSRAIKYMFKYINKPEDRAMATVQANQATNGQGNAGGSMAATVRIDEIKAFMDCRYITAGEACWRLFKFDLYSQSPSVKRLSFHLPGENKVYSTQRSNVQSLIESQTSLLLGWMETNRTSAAARRYTFVEFPQHYTWNRKLKKWQIRKQRLCIGRLYYCYPSAKDRYYLRLLLHVVRGCRSYEEIRTVNGVVHDTFKEACYALGLLAVDDEWTDCIKEVSFWASGSKMRNLFVTILIHNQVPDVKTLWEENWELLSDDLIIRQRRALNLPNLQLCPDQLKELCLIEIEKLLLKHWKSLSDFPGLPVPVSVSGHSYSNRMLAMELNYDASQQKAEFDAMYPRLNADQRAAFVEILQSVDSEQGKCFFVDGFGGTGKTLLWQVLCLKLRSQKRIVLCVASSGIAALLMTEGRTAHSRFYIPIDCESTSTCHIDQGSELAELLLQTSLIIWDEACMSHKHNIEAVDRTLRDILHIKHRHSKVRTFGGLTVVFGGDFRQTLPVVPKGTRNQILNASIKKSYIWEHITVLKLTQNMRLRCSMGASASESEEISAFSSWILQIGDGIGSNVFGESTLKIPTDLCIQPRDTPISDVVNSTYPDLSTCYADYKYLVERAILAPHHEAVSAINSHVLLQFPGESRCYLSSDSIEVDPGQPNIMESDYSTEFLNSLRVGNFPDHDLKLKIGCPVILLRNLDQSIGFVNGTRLVITKLGTWFIEVEILTGTNIGERVFLPRLKLSERFKSLHFTLVRRQYPISLSFAMTINKSQGQTLNHVGLYLHKQVFCHGQLYVALSRVTRKTGIQIYSCNTDGEHVLTMQNVVYREILE